MGEEKDDHTYTLLGYHARNLQEHIEGHPNYEGDEGMDIDHMFSISL